MRKITFSLCALFLFTIGFVRGAETNPDATTGDRDSKVQSDQTSREVYNNDCAAVDVPFAQDFEDVTPPDLPDCGTTETISGNDWKTTSNTFTSGFESTVLNYSYDFSADADSWYFTQGINLEAGVDYQISYSYGNLGAYPEKLKVAFGTSAASSAMNTEIIDHTNITSKEDDEINFTVDTDGVYYFGFQAHSDANQNQLYVDDIFIGVTPTCFQPTDLAVDNITPNSADILWNASGGESQWQVVVGSTGFDPNGGTPQTVTETTTALTGLDAETDYDVYVRADCGAGDTSYWEGPVSFATPPTCPGTSGLEVTNITPNTAQVAWDAGGDETDWEVVVGSVNFDPNGGTPQSVTETTTTLTGLDAETDYEVYVRADCGAGDTSSWEGPVSFTTLPTCPAPTNVEVINIGTNSAEVNWTAVGDETDWEIIFDTVDFDPDNGTPQAVTETSTTLTGLETNSTYDVYVRANCSDDDTSTWAGPITFTTSCEATDIPFTQDFESVQTPDLPDCARQETSSGTDWKTNPSATGFNGQVLNHSWALDPADSWYFIQGINLEAGVDYIISYKYTNGTEFFTEKLKVAFGTSPDSESMTEELADHDNINSEDVLNNEISFTVDVDGIYYFGFQAYSDANQNQLFVDDINIDAAPTCPQPSDILFDYITNTSANVSWTAGGDETAWDVIYGPEGFDPTGDEATIISDDDGELGVLIENLSPDTEYDVYVRATCGDDGESDLAGPESFTTYINPPENNYLCDAIALTANNGCGDGPYNNIGAFEEVDEPIGSCMNNFHGTNTVWFSFVAPDNGEVTVTTDFDDTDFQTEIVVFEAPTDCDDLSTLGNEVGCATTGAGLDISGLNPGDTYYVKVDGFNNAEGNFCIEVQTDGSVNECEAPTDITFSTNDDYSIDVSWTPAGDETQWEVLYGEEGFNPENDEGQSVMANDMPETTLSDLIANTEYDVYVRAICSEDNVSDWTGPESFNSGDMSVKDQLFENFTFYPNPVDDQLTLKAGTPIESVTVYNLLGQTVMTETPNQLQTQLQTESLQSGVYIMKISLNGSNKTFRVVKK